MSRGGSACWLTRQTSAPLDSANWNWWAQSAAQNAGGASAKPELWAACACHSCPLPDARGRLQGTLGLGTQETSKIPDGGGAHSTVRSPVLARFPGRRTRWWCRCVYSHGSWFRTGPFSRAGPVVCGRGLEFGSFHPRRARSPVAEDSDRGQPRRSTSPETLDLAT